MKELLEKLKIETFYANTKLVQGNEILSHVASVEVVKVEDVQRLFKEVVKECVPKDYRITISRYVERKDVGGLAEWIRAVFDDIKMLD